MPTAIEFSTLTVSVRKRLKINAFLTLNCELLTKENVCTDMCLKSHRCTQNLNLPRYLKIKIAGSPWHRDIGWRGNYRLSYAVLHL